MATTLLRTQRRMLRLIIGTPRRTSQPSSIIDDNGHNLPNDNDNGLEPWCDFLQRTTHIAETIMSKHNITRWTTTYFRRKWRWAQRLATLPNDRWCRLVTRWRPDSTEQRPAYRKQGRPRKRWCDDINDFITHLHHNHPTTTTWVDITDKNFWRLHEKYFINYKSTSTTNIRIAETASTTTQTRTKYSFVQ